MDAQSTTSTLDVYQIVTDQIISLLKQGIIPWQKPWKDCGIPMNLMSKRHYRGINLWLLLSLNYEKSYFLTWDQIKGLGASVNRDEKGHIVVFWKMVPKKDAKDDEQKKVPILRYYKVFNVEQCRDIPQSLIPSSEEVIREFTPLLECESIINTMPDCPKIVHKEQKAYYQLDTDAINMPKKKSFNSEESYYATLYHELVHSTGAEKRLNRKSLKEAMPFGSKPYAMEELVAEMGSSYLCQFSGILPSQVEHQVAYVHNWLQVFENDKRFLIMASGHAQKAVDFILGKADDQLKKKEGEYMEIEVD